LALSRYSVEIDVGAASTSHALAILNVAPESSVLDIGAADGSVARRLVERGCRVFGVEIDPEAARHAEDYCERVVVGDVEKIDLAAAVDGAEFDVVLLLDVLEHLHDPLTTLRAGAERLKPAGRVIVSVPNVTHAAVRLQLLSGRFQDAEHGLLDGTHLRLFDRSAIERLFSRANLTVIDRLRTTAGLTETEIEIDPRSFPPEAVSLALSGEDAETYQFVYVASSARASTDAPSLGEALQRRIREVERVHGDTVKQVQSLQNQLDDTKRERDQAAQREADAEARLLSLEDELRRRMAELDGQHEDLRHAEMHIAVRDEQLAELRAELLPLRARLDQLEQALGRTRRRVVYRVKATTSRAPRLHRRLKRLANWVESHRS
jgi:2-polyprenyl-3-methyl-5-hydroxy-6-metoxy-1,4-benzoquinol methylase